LIIMANVSDPVRDVHHLKWRYLNRLTTQCSSPFSLFRALLLRNFVVTFDAERPNVL